MRTRFTHTTLLIGTAASSAFMPVPVRANRDEVIKLVIDELQRIKSSGITPEELQRSQDQIKGNMYLGLESVSNRMTRLGKSEIYHDRVIDPDEVIEKVSRVTRDQVIELADQMIKQEKMVLTTIGPEQERRLFSKTTSSLFTYNYLFSRLSSNRSWGERCVDLEQSAARPRSKFQG